MNTTGSLVVACLLATGCTARITTADGGTTGPSPAQGPGLPGASGTAPMATNGLPSSGLRRLTRTQFANSVKQLLGASLSSALQLPPDEVADEGFEFRSVGASRATTAALGVDQYDAQARALSQQVFADATARVALVGCTPSTANDACVSAFLERFGRRALRRPLTAAEVERYAALVRSGADALGIWRGLEAAVAAFLASPAFLYRAELGSSEPASTRLRLDDFEVATRLSFLLWDSTPDDALLDAAQSGQLATSEGLESELTRLFASPLAEATLTRYFAEWLGFQELGGLPKDAQAFPGYTPELARAMEQELETWVSRELLQGVGSVLSLYSTRTTYVNGALAQHYGLTPPAGDGVQKVTLPESAKRAGLLTFAGLLTSNSRAITTSPTLRGRYVRERLLCGVVPPPPPNVETALPPPPADGSVETMRERLRRHASEPGCAACHSLMDPLGLALEHYDAVGTYRELDQGKAIDASGTLDGVGFAGAVELGQALERHPEAARCVGRQLARHAWGQEEASGEDWIFDALAQGFEREGHTVQALVRALVQHESFRFSGGLR